MQPGLRANPQGPPRRTLARLKCRGGKWGKQATPGAKPAPPGGPSSTPGVSTQAALRPRRVLPLEDGAEGWRRQQELAPKAQVGTREHLAVFLVGSALRKATRVEEALEGGWFSPGPWKPP